MFQISFIRSAAGIVVVSSCLLACDGSTTTSDSWAAGTGADAPELSTEPPQESRAEEPPFFVVDPNATGPLTLAELKIHIPADIDKDLKNRQRKCFLARVEELAQEAGEPSDIDPDDFRYWGGNTSREDWLTLNREQHRALLAQAIVSFAFQDCL